MHACINTYFDSFFVPLFHHTHTLDTHTHTGLTDTHTGLTGGKHPFNFDEVARPVVLERVRERACARARARARAKEKERQYLFYFDEVAHSVAMKCV